MFWQLALIASVFWVVYFRWQRRRIRKVYEEISPGELSMLPVIGHAHNLMGDHEDIMKLFQKIASIANNHGGLSSFWMGNKLFIIMTDPLSVEVIMKSCLDKGDYSMKFIRTVLGNGSIFATVNIWRPRRKILAPMFSIKNLNHFMDIFVKQSAIMTEQLALEAEKGDLSLWKYITTYTFDSVCESSLGIELKSQLNPNHPFLHSFEKISNMVAERSCTIWLHPDIVYKSLPKYKDFVKHREVIYNFVDELIRNKREELKNNNNEEPEESYRPTFLEMMIKASGGEKGYTALELREEVMVIMMAGTDTSAVGAAYASILISRYPDVQAKLFTELQDVFGDSDRPLTVQDLPSLKYLDAVVKETLRLYPPVPVIVREVHSDVTLPSKCTLVDGVSALINIWGIHRNPKYWGEDADQFKPERFLNQPLQHPAQFIPFSYSPRNCIGYNYAYMSIKTVLATLLRKYRLLPPKDMNPSELQKPLKLKYEIMIKPVDGFIVRLEHRNKTKNVI